MSSFRILLAASAAVLMTGAAHAAVITYSSTPGNTPLADTAFTTNLVVPKFDPTLGTLTGIGITLSGTVVAQIGVESTSAGPGTINYSSGATLTLSTPSNAAFLVLAPSQGGTYKATAYDGTTDFAGSSGTTISDFTATATGGGIVPVGQFAAFIGGGTINLPTHAQGSSAADGPGNVVVDIGTQASVGATISYTYDVPVIGVPEPASMALIGAGLFGLGLARRRKS